MEQFIHVGPGFQVGNVMEQYSKLDKYLRQLGKRFFSKLTT